MYTLTALARTERTITEAKTGRFRLLSGLSFALSNVFSATVSPISCIPGFYVEATAFQTRDVLEAMEQDSGIKLDVLRADGGMVADDLLMQFQADILDRPVVRPVTKDATTALGAAYAAGLAVGYFKDSKDLRAN